MRRLLVLVAGLTPYGGMEERVVASAIALQARGYQVRVLSRRAVPAANQYARRLRAHGVRLVSPPPVVATLAGDWNTKVRIIGVLVRALSPVLAVAAGLLALIRHRPLACAWRSVAGRARVALGCLILLDFADFVFYRLLAVQCYLHGVPDLVHAHGYRLDFWQGVVWGRRRNLPTIYEEHSSPAPGFGYHPQALASPFRPTMLVAVSEPGSIELARRFGPGAEVAVIPPIIEGGNGEGEGDRYTGSIAEQASRLTVTCIARLIPEKGLEYLLLAARSVLSEHPGLRFVIIGDGPLREELLVRAHRLGLAQSLCFRGAYTRRDLPGIMGDIDIFVLPSVTEGLPLVVLEAMAWGKPIVATAVGGIPEVITDGVTGLLVPPRDAEALARALASLVDDRARRAQLGRAAYRAFRDKGFAVDTAVDKLLAVYDRAIDKNRATLPSGQPRPRHPSAEATLTIAADVPSPSGRAGNSDAPRVERGDAQ